MAHLLAKSTNGDYVFLARTGHDVPGQNGPSKDIEVQEPSKTRSPLQSSRKQALRCYDQARMQVGLHHHRQAVGEPQTKVTDG